MATENSAISFSAVFLVKGPPNDASIAQLAQWGKRFRERGMVRETEGNLSFRTRLGYIISGAGVALDALTPETVSEVTGVVYGLNKTSVYVKGMVVPSSETILHAQIYDERPDVNAIFHVHDMRVLKQAAKLGVPVTAVEKQAGTQELVQEALALLKLNKGIRYFVLKGHGTVALGSGLDEAGELVEEMRARAQK
jgi:ribulose-5-phosphate 4-epimerase/fuculose-1-phosphate aldolase